MEVEIWMQVRGGNRHSTNFDKFRQALESGCIQKTRLNAKIWIQCIQKRLFSSRFWIFPRFYLECASSFCEKLHEIDEIAKNRYNVSTKWLFTENRGYRFYGLKWRFDKFRQVSTKFDKSAYPRFSLIGQKTDTLYL